MVLKADTYKGMQSIVSDTHILHLVCTYGDLF